jgi:predicted  nucleic acid-binding Zn-ribbon protein
MEIIVAALGLLESSSGVSFLISIAALIGGGILYFRKTNIEEITSIGTLQQTNLKGMLEQISFLSEELIKARKQLAEIHEQNIQLMEKVRESNRRIQELEKMLDHNRSQ